MYDIFDFSIDIKKKKLKFSHHLKEHMREFAERSNSVFAVEVSIDHGGNGFVLRPSLLQLHSEPMNSVELMTELNTRPLRQASSWLVGWQVQHATLN